MLSKWPSGKVTMMLGEKSLDFLSSRENLIPKIRKAMIHYLKNKVGVVDFANAQGVVMF